MKTYRLKFADGRTKVVEAETFGNAACQWGEPLTGTTIIGIDLVPDPPKPKAVLFVPTGENSLAGEFVLPGYRRVEIDLRETVQDVLDLQGGNVLDFGTRAMLAELIVRAIERGE